MFGARSVRRRAFRPMLDGLAPRITPCEVAVVPVPNVSPLDLICSSEPFLMSSGTTTPATTIDSNSALAIICSSEPYLTSQ